MKKKQYPIKLEIFWELKQWIAGNGFGKDIINNILLFVPFGMSDVIIANRYNDDIADVLDKVYTRDLYFRD